MAIPRSKRIPHLKENIAAVGVAVVMVLATAFHLVRGEFSHLTAPIVVLGIALFIAWGRTKAAPIPSHVRAWAAAKA